MNAPATLETPTLPPQESPLGSPAPASLVPHRFRFTGSGSEYSRIWIINLALTIVSFGLYSAWAKVRREQYFHRHTLLDDTCFDYHGNPLSILKGRIIAWGLLLALATVNELSPEWYIGALILVSPLLPWLLLRSFIFRARNTSYRGLRFSFDGTYLQTAKLIFIWGTLAVASLGIALPIFLQRLKRFQFHHLSYGGQRFQLRAESGGFYGAFLLVSLVVVIPLLIMLALIAVAVILAGTTGKIDEGVAGYFSLAAVGMVIFSIVAAQLLARPFLQVRLNNLVWNNARLGPHAFASDQEMVSLFPIFLSNWVLIFLTLGLFWPWAKIRLAAYRAEHMQMLASGDLEEFIGQAELQKTAIGEEIADAFDLDIAL